MSDTPLGDASFIILLKMRLHFCGLQALLMILDSPLNKAGKIKGIYVHTQKNVLIQVNPQVRLPRTYKRFAGLMTQLLQKLSIRATNGPDKLLKVVKGPVGRHLPSGVHRIGFSRSATKIVPMYSIQQSIALSPWYSF